MGTMVAIDYENGGSIMTDGLVSTVVELGIQLHLTPKTLETASAIHGPTVVAATSSNSHNRIEPISESEKPPILADARDRMRTEAAIEVGNPWMNMASYLAKKAMEKIQSSSQ